MNKEAVKQAQERPVVIMDMENKKVELHFCKADWDLFSEKAQGTVKQYDWSTASTVYVDGIKQGEE